jgi:hypothetical protein
MWLAILLILNVMKQHVPPPASGMDWILNGTFTMPTARTGKT